MNWPRFYRLVGTIAVPCTLQDYASSRETESGVKRVAETYVGRVRVSTVFLWIDHSYGDGPPMLFESMIFGGDHDGHMDRYETWAEAQDGHDAIVAMLRRERRTRFAEAIKKEIRENL